MPRPRIRAISGSNFRSFKAPFRVSLPSNGLLLLAGKNLDTGGSSGSGKSSLVLAIQDALGACPFPSTQLGTWGSDAVKTTKLELEDDGREYSVQRGKKFELIEAGAAVAGSAAQKEERLNELLGLEPEMLQALTYRGQRKPGLFLSKTDAQKKEFLTQLLGLDRFEAAQEKGAARVKELETRLVAARAVQTRLEQSLAEVSGGTSLAEAEAAVRTAQEEVAGWQQAVTEARAAVAAADAAVAEASTAAGAQFEAEIKTADEVVAKLGATAGFKVDTTEQNRLEALLRDCSQRIDTLVQADRTAERAIAVRVSEIQAQILAATKRVAKLPSLRAEGERLGQELLKLDASVCPTCERLWDQAGERKQQIMEALARINAQEEAIGNDQVSIERAQTELAQVQGSFTPNPTIEKMRLAKSRIEQDLAAEVQRLAGAKRLHQAEAATKLAEARTAAAEVRQRRAAAVQEVTRAGAETRRGLVAMLEAESLGLDRARPALNQAQIELVCVQERAKQAQRLQVQLAPAVAETADLERQVATEKDFLHLIGREGFLGGIFDEVLAEIGDETSQTLAAVANTRHCTFRFKSETVTQKGSIARTIAPVITVNGHEAPLEAGLSGGMLSVVELAVDLAVGAVISRRSGVSPGWLILDESLDGLGVVEKECCLEILNKYSRDRLVIVVDHMTEVQGLFTNRILVEYRGGDSRIASST